MKLLSLEPESSASADSATPAIIQFSVLKFLHGEDDRGGAYFQLETYSSA